VAESAGIVIVGAGVMGASIAFHLAERRAGRILVLDQAYVAAGASGRSSGLVRMHYTHPPEVHMALRSLDYFDNWKERFDRPSSFRRTGFVRIVPVSQADRLRANVEMQKACGVHAEVVTREELREMEPGWWLDDVELAAYEPDSGYADAATVAGDLLACARERGADYRLGCRVLRLIVEAGRVVGVETDAGPIAADAVVVAAGAWSRRLFEEAGVPLPLECEFHDVLILERPPGDGAPNRACIDSSLGIYFRPEGRVQTLLGGFDGPRSLDPAPVEPEVSVGSVEAKLRRAAHRVPALAEAGVVRQVTGYYTMTPDNRALLGPVPGAEGLFCCTGFSGMGFKISPAIGLVMSELIIEGEARTVDISSFHPHRFAWGAPIRPAHEYEIDRFDLEAGS
jgi:glycine/D-amino acid oxidase-like deaminating enzyme